MVHAADGDGAVDARIDEDGVARAGGVHRRLDAGGAGGVPRAAAVVIHVAGDPRQRAEGDAVPVQVGRAGRRPGRRLGQRRGRDVVRAGRGQGRKAPRFRRGRRGDQKQVGGAVRVEVGPGGVGRLGRARHARDGRRRPKDDAGGGADQLHDAAGAPEQQVAPAVAVHVAGGGHQPVIAGQGARGPAPGVGAAQHQDAQRAVGIEEVGEAVGVGVAHGGDARGGVGGGPGRHGRGRERRAVAQVQPHLAGGGHGPVGELVAVDIAHAQGARDAAPGGGGVGGDVHRGGPGGAGGQQQVGGAAGGDQQVIEAVAVHVAGARQRRDGRRGPQEGAIAGGRLVQGQLAQGAGEPAHQVGAVAVRLADQQVGQAVAVGVAGGGEQRAQPRPGGADEPRAALGQGLRVRRRGPIARAPINHRHLAAAAPRRRQAHGQVGQAVAVQVAQPGGGGGGGADAACAGLAGAGKAQPDRGVVIDVHADAQLGGAGGERQVAALVGHAGEDQRLPHRHRRRRVGSGPAGQIAGRGHAVHHDPLGDDGAGVARAVGGAQLHQVLALGLAAHDPIVGPVGVGGPRAAQGDAAPGLAVDRKLHPLHAGEVVVGGAPQRDGGGAAGDIAAHRQRRAGRGVVHGDAHRGGDALVAQGVRRPGLQRIAPVAGRAPGGGPRGEAADGLVAGRRALGDGAEPDALHPGGGVAGAAAHDIARAGEQRAVRWGDDGHGGVVAIQDDGDALAERQPAMGQAHGQGAAPRAGPHRDPRGDGGRDHLIERELVGRGERPGIGAAGALRGDGPRARKVPDAHVGEEGGQGQRKGRGDRGGGPVGQVDGRGDGVAGQEEEAGLGAGDPRKRGHVQRQGGGGLVGRVGAEAVALFLGVVQPVLVGVGLQGIGPDPDRRAAGEGHGPAADPGARGVQAADLLAVRQAVAVGIGQVGPRAQGDLVAVGEAVAVAIGAGRASPQRGEPVPLPAVGEAVAVAVPEGRVGPGGGLLRVGQAVAIAIRVHELGPVPQPVEGIRQDVEIDGGWLWLDITFGLGVRQHALRRVGLPAEGAIEAVLGPEHLIAELGQELDGAVDVRGQGIAQGGGVFAAERAVDHRAGAGPAHVLAGKGRPIGDELPLDIAGQQVVVVALVRLGDPAERAGSDLEGVAGDQPQRGLGEGGIERVDLDVADGGERLGVVKELEHDGGDAPGLAGKNAGEERDDLVDEGQDRRDDLPYQRDEIDGKEDDHPDGGDDGQPQRHAPGDRVAPAADHGEGKGGPGDQDADDHADALRGERRLGGGLQRPLGGADDQRADVLGLGQQRQAVHPQVGQVQRHLVAAHRLGGIGVADGVDHAHDGAGQHRGGKEAAAQPLPGPGPAAHPAPLAAQVDRVRDDPHGIAAGGQGVGQAGGQRHIVDQRLGDGLVFRGEGAAGQQRGLVGELGDQGAAVGGDGAIDGAAGPEVGGIGDEAHVLDGEVRVAAAQGAVIARRVALLHQLEHPRRGRQLPFVILLLVHAELEPAGGQERHVGEVDVQADAADPGAAASEVRQVLDAQLLLVGEDQRRCLDRVAGGVPPARHVKAIVAEIVRDQLGADAGQPRVQVREAGRAAHHHIAAGDAKGVHQAGAAPRSKARGDLLQRRLAGVLPFQPLVPDKGVVEPQQPLEKPQVVRRGGGAHERRLIAPHLGHLQAGEAKGVAVAVQQLRVGVEAPVHPLVHLGLGQPDHLDLPLDVVQLAGGVGHLGVKGRDVAAILHRDQRDEQEVPVAVLHDAIAVLVRQLVAGAGVGGHPEEGEEPQVGGGPIEVLHVALLVIGPIQGGGGVAEAGAVGGAHRQLDVLVAVKAAAGGAELGLGRIARGGVGREVQPIGDGVAVVVLIPDVGDSVAVDVGAGPLAVGVVGDGPLQGVGEAVAVGVHPQRVAGPGAALPLEPGQLDLVGEGVAVGIGAVGVGAQAELGGVAEGVAIGVLGRGAIAAAGQGRGLLLGQRHDLGGGARGGMDGPRRLGVQAQRLRQLGG